MTGIIRKIVYALGLLGVFLLINAGCRVSYSLSGASIHADARTFSVAYFPVTAPLSSPILATTFREALQDKFSNQTKLSFVQDDGDLAFEGEIIGYSSVPTAITAEDQFAAAMNRLTITVKVRFKNRLEPEYDFERTFSHYENYDSNEMLSSKEGELIPVIVKMIVDDIYTASVSNW